jgi:hypothetical protein
VTPIATPPALLRLVPTTFPGAVQTIAALEERITLLRSLEGDQAWAIVDAHAALAQVREAFDLWPVSEAALDAAHEAHVADMAELSCCGAEPPFTPHWVYCPERETVTS